MEMVKDMKSIISSQIPSIKENIDKAMSTIPEHVSKATKTASKNLKKVEEDAEFMKKTMEDAAKAADKAVEKMSSANKSGYTIGGEQRDLDPAEVERVTAAFEKRKEAQQEAAEETARQAIELLKVEETLRQTVDNIQSKTNAYNQLNQTVEEVSKTTREISGTFSSLKPNLKDTTKTLGATTKEFESFSKILKIVGKNFASLAKNLGSVVIGKIKSLANSFSSLFKNSNKGQGAFSKLISSFNRIIKYRIVSGIINSITKAIKDGTDNLYQYSKIASGQFSSSMDKAATSVQYFKNSVGAAISPLVNTFVPIFDMMIDKVVDFINVLNQMLAKLTGASTWTKAIKVQKEYAESANNAAKSTKGMLASFDEVNILSKNDSSSKNEVDYSSMFEEIPIEEVILPNFVQQLIYAVNNENWAELGRVIADKINSVVENINLVSLGEKLGEWLNNALTFLESAISNVNWKTIGEKLGEGLNKLVDTIDSGIVGDAIAAVINAVVDLFNSFMDKINFGEIGEKIGEAINHILDKVNWKNLGEFFAQKWVALIDALYEIIKKTDWEKVGKAIAEFIKGWFEKIPWDKVGETLALAINALITTIGTVISETDWNDIVKRLTFGLNHMIKHVDWRGLGITAGRLFVTVLDSMEEFVKDFSFEGLASAIFDLLSGAIGTVLGWLVDKVVQDTKDWWNDLWKKLKSIFNVFKEDVEKQASGDAEYVGEGILKGIAKPFEDIGRWLNDHIAEPFIQGFKSIFKISSPSKVMEELGGYVSDGFLGGLKEKWKTVTQWLDNALSNIKDTAKNALNNIKNMLSDGQAVTNALSAGASIGSSVLKTTGSGGITKRMERYANGGVITSPTVGLMGEYAGARSNPEIVSPKNIMYETVVEANAPLVSALYDMVREVISEIRNKETSVSIDGEVIGKSASNYITNRARMTGKAFI